MENHRDALGQKKRDLGKCAAACWVVASLFWTIKSTSLFKHLQLTVNDMPGSVNDLPFSTR